MQERQIYCCGASVWTRVIGWYQVISSISLIITSVITMADPSNHGVTIKSTEGKVWDKVSPEEFLFSYLWFIFFIQLVLSLLDCLMGVVLLHANSAKNTRLLYFWIVYTFVSIFTWASLTLAESFTLDDTASYFSEAVSIIVGVAIQGFCLWIVDIHKTEIEYATAAAASTTNHN